MLAPRRTEPQWKFRKFLMMQASPNKACQEIPYKIDKELRLVKTPATVS
jgi:hypothetical protein